MILPLTLHHVQLRISAMPSLGYVAGTLKSYLFLSPPPPILTAVKGRVGRHELVRPEGLVHLVSIPSGL